MTDGTGRVLIAGVGNIFLGDDGFGVQVAERLAKRDLPAGVLVGDYGTSGMHLAYDLAEGIDTAILVDAVPRGGRPGTVYVIEPALPATQAAGTAGPAPAAAFFDGHGMQPDVVLSMLGTLGGQVGQVLIVGCEPASVDYGIGLSPQVAAAVDEAVKVVLRLIGADEGDEADEADEGEEQESGGNDAGRNDPSS
ncbi:MAG TPA: hydrogenase maturation protease [Streptosporangiaceae bacterium]|jgi:hydrogenase maturation protease|nr:hydrogenase maturation protease [Streptosporangiaceae bacterium]